MRRRLTAALIALLVPLGLFAGAPRASAAPPPVTVNTGTPGDNCVSLYVLLNLGYCWWRL
jgi:hypothetical protein